MKEFVQNSERLVEVFGKFPTFHDAEVVEINLTRKWEGDFCPTLSALIYIQSFNTYDKFLVKLIFKNVFGLKLENFNHQNVLQDLFVSDFSDEYFEKSKHDKRLKGVVGKREIEKLDHYVKFEYCFGIDAEFLCGEIIAESIEPIATQDLKNI